MGGDALSSHGVFGPGPFENGIAIDLVCDLEDSEDPAALLHDVIAKADDTDGKIDVISGLGVVAVGAIVTATECESPAVDIVRRCITGKSLSKLRAGIVQTTYGPNSELEQLWSRANGLEMWQQRCQTILERWPRS